MASKAHCRLMDSLMSVIAYACFLHYAYAADCLGQLRSTDSGIRLLDFTAPPAGCSTNRALGYAIGREFGDSIVERIDALGPQLQKALNFSLKKEGQAALESLTEATSAAYPQYWEELLGIAEGSGVPKELILLLNFRQELSILADGGHNRKGADDCSDVMVSLGDDPRTAFLGHNEDNTADTVNTTYFVQAKLNGRSWTAYTYAGELSSAAWGFNDAGVSFTLNALYATEVQTTGVGRNFVSRSVLDATSLRDATAKITVPNQATGHNINIIGLDSKHILTIETGPGNTSDAKLLRNESYFHANAYKRLHIPQVPGPSSKHREKRAAEFKDPKTREDVLRILGDTKDAKYPIWRSGSDDEFTLCTAFFDLQAETVEVFFSNPKQDLGANSVKLALRQPSQVSQVQ